MVRWRSLLWSGLLLLGVMCSASPGFAAELTDVADSFDYKNKNPFDFRLSLSYEFTLTTANIARERGTRPEQYFDYVPEFRLNYNRHALHIRPVFGLFLDLEVYAQIPIIFSETYSIRPTQEAATLGSTLLNDGIVDSPNKTTKHGPGLGDMSVGIQWAPFNDQRDKTKATWVLGMNWQFPTGVVWDPNDPKVATGQSGIGVGRGMHTLTWHISASKRASIFDPYMRIWYSLFLVPTSTKQNLQVNLGYAEAVTARAVDEALKPSHAGGIVLGTEIVMWENWLRQQKLALDLRFSGRGQFEGRDYNLFTDMLASYRPKSGNTNLRVSLITDHEQYFAFQGMAAFHFRLAKYGYIRIEGSLEHTLPYFLTHAKRGVDKDGNGYVNPGTDEEYPYHVRQLDGIGKRIRQLDTLTWRIQIFAALTI